MASWKWQDNQIKLDKNFSIGRFKKITGTRAGGILNVNPFKTPFQMWCEITKTYEEPFSGNIYTTAGDTIEPKQLAYFNQSLVLDGWKVKTPEDVYGENFKQTTRYDFFSSNKIFGGMWDGLVFDESNKMIAVVECKTTTRGAKDWANGIPPYYEEQVKQYCYDLGLDKYYVVVSFLEEYDLINPEAFEPNYNNTVTYEKTLDRKTYERDVRNPLIEWYNQYVVNGISPPFEEKDMDIVKILRTEIIDPTKSDDFNAILNEIATIEQEIEDVVSTVSEQEKQLKKLKDLAKAKLLEQLGDDKDKVELGNDRYQLTLSRSYRTDIDKKKLQADGLLEKYATKKETLTLRGKKIGG